jgi:hypothetical protein
MTTDSFVCESRAVVNYLEIKLLIIKSGATAQSQALYISPEYISIDISPYISKINEEIKLLHCIYYHISEICTGY